MPKVVPNVDTTTLDEDLEARRQKVMNLRLRHVSEAGIAMALGCSTATVSRDLEFIRREWREQYGAAPSLEPGEVVGEAMALFRETERELLKEHAKLGAVPTTPLVARTRIMALEAVGRARERQIALLMDIGVLDRALGTVRVHEVPRATELRRLMRETVVNDADLIPPAEMGLAVIDVE